MNFANEEQEIFFRILWNLIVSDNADGLLDAIFTQTPIFEEIVNTSTGPNGQTLATFAVSTGKLPCAAVLFGHGAGMHVQDEHGNTPFALTNDATMATLVEAGVKLSGDDISKVCSWDQTMAALEGLLETGPEFAGKSLSD